MVYPEHEPPEPSLTPMADNDAELNDAPACLQPLVAEEAPPAALRDAFPAWSAWDVIAVLCFTVAAVVLFSSIGLGIARALTIRQHVPWGELATNPKVVIGSQLAAYPVVILFMISVVRNKTRTRFWQAIRWNWDRRATAGYLLSGVVFAFLVEFASRWLPIPKSLPMDKFFSDITGAYLMAVFGITLAPLLEELFFRGMLYPIIRRAYGMIPGVVLTGAAFASIHGAQLGYAWGPLLSIFVVGIVFTVVRERTGSVAAAFLMHCGYNFALFGSLWVASDHFRHLEKALG